LVHDATANAHALITALQQRVYEQIRRGDEWYAVTQEQADRIRALDRRTQQQSDLVSRIWDAVGGNHDEESIVAIVADMRKRAEQLEAQNRALRELIDNAASCDFDGGNCQKKYLIEGVRAALATPGIAPATPTEQPAR
jgi:hypothetical protein